MNHVQPQVIHTAVHENKFFFNLFIIYLLRDRGLVAWKIRWLKITKSGFGCFTLSQLIMWGQQRLNSF
jgi:hypothetical protein